MSTMEIRYRFNIDDVLSILNKYCILRDVDDIDILDKSNIHVGLQVTFILKLNIIKLKN